MQFLKSPACVALTLLTCLSGCSGAPDPDCGDAPVVEHATVVVSDGGDRLYASYVCDDGFGWAYEFSQSATCLPGQPSWSGPSNHCVSNVAVDMGTGLDWQRFVSAGTADWSSAATRCATLDLTGGGWRLPTIRELSSLYEYDDDDDDPRIELVGRGFHWSSTGTASAALILDFDTGTLYSGQKDTRMNVRCVRGPELSGPSWSSNGDGTATDATTGLTWQAALTNTNAVNFASAEAHCAAVTTADGGFRVPTMPELISAIDFRSGFTGVDEDFLTDAPAERFWSSSYAPSGHWTIDFYDVSFKAHAETSFARVRCVRDAE